MDVNGSKGWRIVNQSVRREEGAHHQHLSCATIQSRLYLMLNDNDANAVCIPNRSHTPADYESACCSAPSSCKKVESMTCAQRHAGKKGREQWVEGEEGGAQRDHHGCEHRRAAARATLYFARKVPENIPKGYLGL